MLIAATLLYTILALPHSWEELTHHFTYVITRGHPIGRDCKDKSHSHTALRSEIPRRGNSNFICTGWYCGAVEVHASLVIGVVRDSAYDCGHEITLARRNFSHGGLVLLSLFVFGTMESDLGLCTGDGSGMKSHIKEDNNYKHMLKPY
jgi:hypothetical protein